MRDMLFFAGVTALTLGLFHDSLQTYNPLNQLSTLAAVTRSAELRPVHRPVHRPGLGQAPYAPSGPMIEVVLSNGKKFVITTDPVHSPKTVAQILSLVKSGFYNSQKIHRVEDWVVQWGAPASKTAPLMIPGKDGKPELNPKVGDGDSGHPLPFEESGVDFYRGVVGIASNGLQLGGDCQLFVLKSIREYLYRSYAVVGLVTSGMDVVDHIKFGDRIKLMRILPRTTRPR